MLERFLENMLEGALWMIGLIVVCAIVWFTALPLVSFLIGSANWWVVFWYLLILPFDYAVWQTFF